MLIDLAITSGGNNTLQSLSCSVVLGGNRYTQVCVVDVCHIHDVLQGVAYALEQCLTRAAEHG